MGDGGWWRRRAGRADGTDPVSRSNPFHPPHHHLTSPHPLPPHGAGESALLYAYPHPLPLFALSVLLIKEREDRALRGNNGRY